MTKAKAATFGAYERTAISILVFLQFTMVLDFMVMAPLGAVIMPVFGITPQQFSFIVASYALSACMSGFLSAGFADRFERKRYLIVAYVGFILGTASCALADTYETLLVARIVTGLFGGIIASTIQTLTTDIFDEGKRGRVIGFTQISFGFCQVFGLPIALSLSNRFSWHAPFVLVVVLALALLTWIGMKLKPLREHLSHRKTESHWGTFARLASSKDNFWGFIGTMTVTLGGYLLMPFTSAYNVANLGMSLDQLPYFYLFSGLSVIIFAPVIGKLADLFGNMKVFTFGVFLTATVAIIFTNLQQARFAFLCATNILLFAGFFSIIIPFQSLVSRLPAPKDRGGFMSINASLQQLGGGLSVLLAGAIVSKGADGKLQGFSGLGTALAVILTSSLLVAWRMSRKSP